VTRSVVHGQILLSFGAEEEGSFPAGTPSGFGIQSYENGMVSVALVLASDAGDGRCAHLVVPARLASQIADRLALSVKAAKRGKQVREFLELNDETSGPAPGEAVQ
jgi:hypothetical protein